MTKYLALVLLFFVPQFAGATAFYSDAVNGSDAADGLATTTAFQSTNQFTNNARSAGDILFVRSGQASTTDVTAMTMTSSGNLNAPITIQTDKDKLWPQDFATSSQTVTPVFGATTMEASASTTNVGATQWIHVDNDCQERFSMQTPAPTGNVGRNSCEFWYEVKSVSNTTITLYKPYKGAQSGAGRSLVVRSAAPQIGVITEPNQIITMSADNFWVIDNLDLRSTNASCVASIAGAFKGSVTWDMIYQGNGAGDCGRASSDIGTFDKKARIFNVVAAYSSPVGGVFDDYSIDCNSVANSNAFNFSINNSNLDIAQNGTIVNCTNTFAAGGVTNNRGTFINVTRPVSYASVSGGLVSRFFFQDDQSVVGLNSQTSFNISANTLSTTTVSTTTPLRAGGGPTAMWVLPPAGTGNTGISTYYPPFSYMKLVDVGLYAAASVSKTYSIFVSSTSTTNFTADPFTDTQAGSSTPEFYIECEYYNESSGADKMLKRSNTAGAIDFNGATTWQSLSVTCVPTQAGVLRIRLWYAKPREAVSNYFLVDPTVVIS